MTGCQPDVFYLHKNLSIPWACQADWFPVQHKLTQSIKAVTDPKYYSCIKIKQLWFDIKLLNQNDFPKRGCHRRQFASAPICPNSPICGNHIYHILRLFQIPMARNHYSLFWCSLQCFHRKSTIRNRLDRSFLKSLVFLSKWHIRAHLRNHLHIHSKKQGKRPKQLKKH